MSEERKNDEDDLDTFLEASGVTFAENDPVWRLEWQNMPEFVQEKQEAFATVVVRFRSQDDLEDFARRIDQQVNPQTKSIWHPYKSHWGGPSSNKQYVDEP